MTAPWAGAPPELLRLLLESGSGSGPTRAAADAWMRLGNKYFYAAQELQTTAVHVRTNVWQGESASAYADRHDACARVLWRFGTRCIKVTHALLQVAAAYDNALAGMPTLAEVAENRAIETMAVVTNFFGLNTPLIAFCELEYMEMWLRAAAEINIYDLVATEAVVLVSGEEFPAPERLITDIGAVLGVAASDGAAAATDGEIGGIAAAAASLVLGPIAMSATPITSIGIGSGTTVPTSVPLGIGRHLDGVQASSAGVEARQEVLAQPSVVFVAESCEVVPQLDASRAVQRITRPAAMMAGVSAPVSVVVGDRGAGSMGFAGTAAKEVVAPPSGLTALVGDEFGDGPLVPMVPATWDPYGNSVAD